MKKPIWFNACYIIVLSILLLLLLMTNKGINSLNRQYSELEITSALRADSLRKIFDFFKNDAFIVCDRIKDCEILNVTTKKQLNLFSILNRPSNVLIRLIDTDCNSCNQRQEDILNELLCNYENIIVLSNVTNIGRLRLFLHDNSFNFKSVIYCLNAKNKLFQEDDTSKVLVAYVGNEGTILKAHYFDHNSLFLIKMLI